MNRSVNASGGEGPGGGPPDGPAVAPGFDLPDDPIVAEVRAAREALFAAAGYDLEEFGRQIRASEAAEGRTGMVRPGDKSGGVPLPDPGTVTGTVAGAVVSRAPDVHSDDLVFAGTRVPARALLDYVRGGHTLREFLDAFPTVAASQADGFLALLVQAIEGPHSPPDGGDR